MRKALFSVLVVASILSTIGLGYLQYFRQDCKPLSNGVMTRDWKGNCYLTITSSYVRVTGEPFNARVEQKVTRYKWYDGMWMSEEWLATWAP
jgi:hypothetical protein